MISAVPDDQNRFVERLICNIDDTRKAARCILDFETEMKFVFIPNKSAIVITQYICHKQNALEDCNMQSKNNLNML
jgi:hypothetical protein